MITMTPRQLLSILLLVPILHTLLNNREMIKFAVLDSEVIARREAVITLVAMVVDSFAAVTKTDMTKVKRDDVEGVGRVRSDSAKQFALLESSSAALGLDGGVAKFRNEQSAMRRVTTPSMHDQHPVPLYIITPTNRSTTTTAAAERRGTSRRRRRLVVYFHGGGWVVGHPLDLGFPWTLAETLEASVVIAVQYRLAPEHPFPKPLEDCLTGVVWAVTNAPEFNADPNELIITGISAGGNLALATAYAYRDLGYKPIPKTVIPLIPPLSPLMSFPSYYENFQRFGLTPERMAWYWAMYAEDLLGCARNATCSPLQDGRSQNGRGLMRNLIVVVGEGDCLRDDGVLYYETVKGSVEKSKLVRLPSGHGFFLAISHEGIHFNQRLRKLVEEMD